MLNGKLSDKAMGPNARAGVSERVVSGEPMYIIVRDSVVSLQTSF